jgi:hypothetical protein
MKLVVKTCVAAFSIGLVVATLGFLAGCEGPGEATTTKPIESNILKKLGQANQSQSAVDQAKTRVKAKSLRRQ